MSSELHTINTLSEPEKSSKISVVGKLHVRITSIGRKGPPNQAPSSGQITDKFRKRKNPYSTDMMIVKGDHHLSASRHRPESVSFPKRVNN